MKDHMPCLCMQITLQCIQNGRLRHAYMRKAATSLVKARQGKVKLGEDIQTSDIQTIKYVHLTNTNVSKVNIYLNLHF